MGISAKSKNFLRLPWPELTERTLLPSSASERSQLFVDEKYKCFLEGLLEIIYVSIYHIFNQFI